MKSSVALTQDLVRFKTINPPGDEAPCARFLGSMLEEAGFSVEFVPLGDNRDNLIARIGGQDGASPICLSGHTDVVPLGAAPWSFDPFCAEIADGRILGRGTTDMKGGVAAIVTAALKLAPKLANTPGVVLVITAGEERGCEGANLLAREGRLPRAGAMVIAEPTSNEVWAGHKGVFWLEGVSKGVTAHGSMPHEGVNAVYKAARAALALEAFEFTGDEKTPLGAPTINVGWLRGGMNVNSVPDEARFGVDLRITPGISRDDVLSALRAAVKGDAEFEVMGTADAVWTDPSDPWLQRVAEVTRGITGESRPIGGASYFTDAGALKPAMGNPPTVILGPGEPRLAHQTDESCSIERIEQAEAIYSQLIAEWCGL